MEFAVLQDAATAHGKNALLVKMVIYMMVQLASHAHQPVLHAQMEFVIQLYARKIVKLAAAQPAYRVVTDIT